MEAAVVSSTQGAVRILLGKLGDVLATKYALLGGVREEIQELKDELESMTACLRDLADGGNDDGHNEQMRTWMKQVREVAYDVEDCIDAFCHHLGKHSGTSCLHRMIKLLRTIRVRHKLAAEIKSLQSRAQKVSDRRLRYRLDVATGASSNRSSNEPGSSGYLDLGRRLPALHGDGSRLVGMGGRTDELVGLLEEGDAARLRVVSIVGFGGLGKTTLAMTVYTSPAVRGVQCRAFVAVSQTYDLRSLLESVLKQTYPVPSKDSKVGVRGAEEDPLQGIKTWDIAELVSKSRDYLADKRSFFGHSSPPAPCSCRLKQAWGSLDALVGRLRAAFEEHGGRPEANPFGVRAVRLYLRQVCDSQAKARGIAYEKKRLKRHPATPKQQKQQAVAAPTPAAITAVAAADVQHVPEPGHFLIPHSHFYHGHFLAPAAENDPAAAAGGVAGAGDDIVLAMATTAAADDVELILLISSFHMCCACICMGLIYVGLVA